MNDGQSNSTSPHACAVIDRPAHFSQLAESFLQDGAATGLLPLLVDANRAMDMYGDIVEHRPHRVVERFVELGHDARDRGYRGLCAVADVTPLLATAESRDAYWRYEILIERRMRQVGFLNGLCIIDASKVGARTGVDLCRFHEVSNHQVDFRVFSDDEGQSTVLAGQIDSSNSVSFERCIDAVADSGPLHLRLDRCEFVDHRALVAIDLAAARYGMTARLEGGPTVLAKLTELLQLRNVEVTAP